MARAGTGGAHATVVNNNVNHINTATEPYPLAAIYLQSNDGGLGANSLRLDVRGNTVPSTTAYDLDDGTIVLIASNGGKTYLFDNTPASASPLSEAQSQNTGSVAVVQFNSGTVTLTNTAPTLPPAF